jgi:hypothetical protein
MKKVLVTENERRKIAKEAVVEMGSKVTSKVLDIDKVVQWIRTERKNKNLSPYIEIHPISEDQFKNPHKQATFQKDPLTGVLYGIATSSDDFGNIRWQKIQVNEMLSLNLDNDNDAKIWAVIRFNPDIQGSPFQRENPYFKIYDPVDEAIAEQNEIAEMQKAFERVSMVIKDSKRMVQFARYLGVEVRDNTNYDIVYGALLKKARHNSAVFNKHFYSGLALGVITEDANNGYMYEGITLGISKADAIKFLAKDKSVFSSISTALDEKDTAVKGVVATVNVKEKVSSDKEEDDNNFE